MRHTDSLFSLVGWQSRVTAGTRAANLVQIQLPTEPRGNWKPETKTTAQPELSPWRGLLTSHCAQPWFTLHFFFFFSNFCIRYTFLSQCMRTRARTHARTHTHTHTHTHTQRWERQNCRVQPFSNFVVSRSMYTLPRSRSPKMLCFCGR